MSLAAASSACADTKSTFIVLALKLPLERNIYIYSLPQPAGPVKVANGGHLSGTKKQVAGYDKNSWLRLANYGNRWHSGCVLQRDTGVPGSS